MALVLDIHALHSLPPSLINRDDTGAPKTAIFGGVPRQRVSSQSAKRAIRKTFEETMDQSKIGIRTRRVANLIVERVLEKDTDWAEEKAAEGVEALFKPLKIKLVDPPQSKDTEEESEADARRRLKETGYLLFLSNQQIDKAAQAIIDHDGEKFMKKEAQEILDTDHSVDIAMFGRMVADNADFNVDASVQVAHAISVHEAEPEFDYFTAVDDYIEDQQHETGAGMIGTIQMMSSTLYRYATVDIESLQQNLGDRDAAVEATAAFVQAFVESMPTGKQNTFANRTLPELIYVTIRPDRAISLVNAFEEPVSAGHDSGRRKESAERLATEAVEIQNEYGFVPTAAFVAGLGDFKEQLIGIAEQKTLPELYEAVAKVIDEELK